jgi:hypothetical protein
MSHAPYEPIPQAPPQWAQQPVQPGRAPSRLLPILGVVLGSLGLIAGVGAWFRAAPSNEAASAVYSEQQVSEAKTAVCEEFEIGQEVLVAVGNKKSSNPSEAFTFSVNSRLAVDVVMDDLRALLLDNPATPDPSTNAVKQLIGNYRELLFKTLSDKSGPDLDSTFQSIDSSVLRVRESCK